jgi:hypothetical protein
MLVDYNYYLWILKESSSVWISISSMDICFHTKKYCDGRKTYNSEVCVKIFKLLMSLKLIIMIN